MQSASSVNQTIKSSNENLSSEKRQAWIVKKQTQQNNETALHASLHQKRLQQRYNKSAITSNAAVINQSDILAQAVQSAQEHEELKTSESSKQSTIFRNSRNKKKTITSSFDYFNEINN